MTNNGVEDRQKMLRNSNVRRGKKQDFTFIFTVNGFFCAICFIKQKLFIPFCKYLANYKVLALGKKLNSQWEICCLRFLVMVCFSNGRWATKCKVLVIKHTFFVCKNSAIKNVKYWFISQYYLHIHTPG